MKAIIKMAVMGIMILLISPAPSARAATSTYPSSSPKPSLGLPAYYMEMQLSAFVKVTARDYQLVTGKKMNIKERVAFSLLKKNMKKSLKKHQDQKVKDYIATMDKSERTTLIIILIVLVVVITAVVIVNAVNDIGPFYTGGW